MNSLALERLKAAARPHPSDGPRTRVLVEREALAALIAKQEGLEREVERLKVVAEQLRVHGDTMGLDRAVFKARADAAEAKFSALEEAAKDVADCWGVGSLNITAMSGFIDALRALLPTVPVEGP